MRHSLPHAPQFYVTAPQPCPYLHGRAERKLFTALHGDNAAELNNALSRQGFRRSQNVLYRPSCESCVACMSARIRVADFKPSRTQRRLIRRNSGLRRLATSAWATEEQFDLFRRYLDERHADGGMADMDIFEFAAMIEETPVKTRVIEYRCNGDHPERLAPGDDFLAAVCLTDVLAACGLDPHVTDIAFDAPDVASEADPPQPFGGRSRWTRPSPRRSCWPGR